MKDYVSIEAAGEAAVDIWRDPQKYKKYIESPMTLNERLKEYESIYIEYRPWQKQMVDILGETYVDKS